MIKVISQKINNSSVQVLKTLKVLMQGEYSMKELISLLNETEKEPIFNNSVISKYINTCRYCGIDIQKINNKYYLAILPFGLKLNQIEVDLLKALQGYIKDEMSVKCSKQVDSFMEKIDHYSNKEILAVNKNQINMTVELFERAISRKSKIKLIFKTGAVLEGIPVKVTYEKGKIYFIVYNKKSRTIELSRLSGMEILDQRYIEPFNGEQVVVFKLRDGLAKRYEARCNEYIEQNNDGSITVTNRNENKDMLFSRLLRYDNKCEIIRPKAYREEMKNIIDDMLKVYGEC